MTLWNIPNLVSRSLPNGNISTVNPFVHTLAIDIFLLGESVLFQYYCNNAIHIIHILKNIIIS